MNDNKIVELKKSFKFLAQYVPETEFGIMEYLYDIHNIIDFYQNLGEDPNEDEIDMMLAAIKRTTS